VLTIPSVSREYIRVPVTGATASMPVEIAIVGSVVEEPAETDWHPATWDGTDARILIGPGTLLTLTDGWYRVWVRVTAGAERPVLRSGLIQIT
jgi:hypothetical protein